MGYYERPRRFTKSNIFAVSLAAVTTSLLVSLAFVYFTYYEMIGRLSLVYGSLGAYFGIASIRFILSQFLRKNPYRFTILGSSNCGDEIIAFCKKNRRETRFYSYVDWKQDLFPSDIPIDVRSLRKAKVPNLVLAKSALDDPEMIEFALQALQEGCRVIDEVTFYIHFFEKVPINDISKNWLLHEGIDTRPIFFSIGKRVFDVASSVIALILLSPLFLLLSLIIKLSSPGPIFFFQIRMGRFCQPFRIIKFRTMTFNPDQKEIISTGLNDPRVTKIGKLMRPLHLDELPQLWNVIFGKMSIVGPRPEAFDFAQKMRKVPLYDLRHLLRPGITGHAQITQGYTRGVVEEMTEKLEYDLFYVCKSNLMLDVRIILRTIFCLMRKAR
jgi:lipopolysaccharide/colanic/teichoic acid biosynthesis glycosyltransferase